LIEQGLTSPPTQYRLYGRQFLSVHNTGTEWCQYLHSLILCFRLSKIMSSGHAKVKGFTLSQHVCV